MVLTPRIMIFLFLLSGSNTTAKKYETELQTLKESNARLVDALQESSANVESWKKELSVCQEESETLRKKIGELEAQCKEANQEKQRNAQLTVRVKELEAELQEKEQVRLQHIHLKTADLLSTTGFYPRACKTTSSLLPLKPLCFTQSSHMKAITAFRFALNPQFSEFPATLYSLRMFLYLCKKSQVVVPFVCPFVSVHIF
ncbi:hypothetical protein XENOCAPTIV_005208 [Xenoophorus captivus]|uniref:Homer scaffold protein 2 n=1 Tax=Xenoophorus captivus TaxID=1517983 RepID=A0ABV0QL90_9TELE